MEIEWTEAAIADMADLEREMARRVKLSIERFAETGTEDIKTLQAVNPPEYRLRVGDFRVRFQSEGLVLRILRILNRRDAYR